MNACALMGRVCNDLELKTTPNGVPVTSFSLAVDRSYTPKGEERQTDFINCVAWRGTAEFIARHWHKGQRMAITGELQQRSYTANDGSKRTVYEVVVGNAYFCESKNAAPPAQQNVQDAAPVQQNYQEFEEIALDEDIPF
jgi:single-strand DNA-binding protein